MGYAKKYRLVNRGCFLLAGLIGTHAAAQQAYFSLQGDFIAAGDAHDFNFSLSRTVGSGEDMRFITFAGNGGTNAAGDAITSGGIDSVLELTDSTPVLHGYSNDASGVDSLIAWTQPTGTALNPDPLPIDAYRLRMYESGNNQAGAWAVDLIAPADAFTLTAATPTGTSTVSSLKFGTDVGGAAATFNQAASLQVTGPLTIAQTGDAVFNNTGSTTVNGLTTINSGGALNITAGSFTAYDEVTSNGAVTVDGLGSSFTVDASPTFWGLNGGTASITISDIAQATIHSGDIFLASQGSGSTGTINLNTASAMTIDSLHLADDTYAATDSTATININSSTLIQSDGANLTLGGAEATNNATINVQNFGDFFTSTTGTVNIAVNGKLNVNTFGQFGALTPSAEVDQDGSTGGSVTTAGTWMIDGGTINFSGGQGWAGSSDPAHADGAAGGTGGTLTLNAGGNIALTLASEVRLFGGYGGSDYPSNSSDNAGSGGQGGTANLTGGVLTLEGTSKFNVNGGLGGKQRALVTGRRGGTGGSGGTINLSGADITLNAGTTLSADGGNGGPSANITNANYLGGAGGQGGDIHLSAGSVMINGGTLSVDGGQGGSSANTNVIGGNGGTINITGGSLTLNSGLISLAGGDGISTDGTLTLEGGAFTVNSGHINANNDLSPTADPINFTGVTLNHTDGSLNLNDNTTFTGGSYTRSNDAALNLATDKKLTATTNALINFTDDNGIEFSDGKTLELNTAADLNTDSITFGDGSTGTLIVDGAGTNLNITGSTTSLFGANGGSASAVVRNGAKMTGGSNWYMVNGSFTATGDNTKITQGDSALLSVGSDTGDSFVLNVQDNAAFTTGSDYTEVISNGTLNVNSGASFTARGQFQINGGTVNLTDGTFTAPGFYNATGLFSFTGGTLHVQTFYGDLLQNGGTLSPGSSAGLTTIDGNYTFNDGTLEIELGGITQDTEYDHIHVTNSADLQGDLNVSLIDDFLPSPGDSFTILSTDGGIIYSLNNISLPDIAEYDQRWQLTNTSSAVILEVISTLAGDLSNDGFVGLNDLDILLLNWNTNVTAGAWNMGDPSGDGFVGLDDLDIILINWNNGTPPAIDSVNIPEPVSAALVLMGGAVLFRRH